MKKIFITILTFFSCLTVHYSKINILYYLIFGLFFVKGIISFYKNCKNYRNITYSYQFYLVLIYYLFNMVSIVLNLQNTSIMDIVKLIMINSVFFIIIEFIKEDHENYIIEVYKKLRNIGTILIFINLIEIFLKKSLFYQFLKGNSKYWQVGSFGTDRFRTFSVFAHPISYATFLVFLFWINIFIPYKSKRFKLLVQIIIVFNIYSTKSRSMWIAFILTVLFYLVLKFKKNYKGFIYRKYNLKKIIYIQLILIILVIGMPIMKPQIEEIYQDIYSRFITVTDDSYQDPSRIYRLQIVESVNEYMLSNGVNNLLIGNGYGTVSNFLVKNQYLLNLDTTDSAYVANFYEFGLIGLLFNIFILLNALITAIKREIENYKLLSIFIFLTLSIVMFFFETSGWPVIMFLYSLSLSVMSININKKSNLLKE